jgi:signal transduction histidine kinase
MTVRFKIACTIFITGALTAIGVVLTVLYAFQRFEHESTYYRANAFLDRVVGMYDHILEMRERHTEEFNGFLRSLVLFEPDTQLYLLDAQGTVLATSADLSLPKGFKVALPPVLQAAAHPDMPYVMGDDPLRMDADAVIAARSLGRSIIGGGPAVAGYLYLVCHKRALPANPWPVVGSSFARPALAAVVGVVILATLCAWWVIATVTRPLRELSEAVAAVSRDGLDAGAPATVALPAARPNDEFGQLAAGFRAMLATLREQWEALRRADHLRREGVSNLSHDLRSPLTATAACLETLDGRWAAEPSREDDRRLVEVALRNTRNAARLVQSLGDLAQLDEPTFRLQAQMMDARELLDDIAVRFGERARQRGIEVRAEDGGEDGAPYAAIDIELFERAVANLVDNALKFCRPGDRITLAARREGHRVKVSVADSGPGIPAQDLPHLFDRYYRCADRVAPATGEGGKGLGLAIVKRIVELHAGEVTVHSEAGVGTVVTLWLPASPA